jgi:hypothetical protein
MKTADEMFREAFYQPRDKRSPEYEPGVLAALKFGLERGKYQTPFPKEPPHRMHFMLGLMRVIGAGVKPAPLASGTGERRNSRKLSCHAKSYHFELLKPKKPDCGS